jgi:protein-L-isoaspartate(D-aspartate) O-methyltransferase
MHCMMSGQRVLNRQMMLWLMIGAILTVNCSGTSATQKSLEDERNQMVEEQIVRRGIKDLRVLEAMRKVPRHLFVPSRFQGMAYDDHPLPIGVGQTISQPYIVALMTELAQVDSDDKVLEIGTGSGYQAAVLSVMAKRVYTIEYFEELAASARQRLKSLKYDNVEVKSGDGYQGWPEHQPFDAILVTAAAEHVPQPLINQLKPGGRLVIPVGPQSESQILKVLGKDERGRISEHKGIPVRFVPLLGEKARGR